MKNPPGGSQNVQHPGIMPPNQAMDRSKHSVEQWVMQLTVPIPTTLDTVLVFRGRRALPPSKAQEEFPKSERMLAY